MNDKVNLNLNEFELKRFFLKAHQRIARTERTELE